MKHITISDKDHETLMELSKELQLQENDHQAFPYFWSPRSGRYEIGTEDDEKVFYLDEGVETAEELFNDLDLKDEYLKNEGMGAETKFSDIDLSSWEDFLEGKEYSAHYRREEKVQENNFSLFKSDVKDHIRCNLHHLGNKPHTYANTIFRMAKMERLIKCIYRLNPQKDDEINHEAKRFVVGKIKRL